MQSSPDKVSDTSDVTVEHRNGYQWTALSVTTVGALLASVQGSALLIALPQILEDLNVSFFIIMQVFIYGGGMGKYPAALAAFMSGVHNAFLISCLISLAAMVVAALRPSHNHIQDMGNIAT